MLVVLGLVFEWRGSHKAKDITDREARRLTTQLEATTEKAGEASERAGLAEQRAAEAEKEVEQLRQTNLVLETKLVQLKADTLPRRITQRQKERFIDLLTHGVVSKCPIKVLVALPADSETTHFALKLREMLDEAGFGTNHESIIGVPYLSNVPQEQNYEKPLDWVLAVYFSPTNQPPNFTDPPAVAVLTNAPNGRLYSQMPFASFSQVANARPIELIPSGQRALVGYFPTKQPTLIMFGVSEVLWGIGIRVGLMPSDRGILVKPGEVAFLVPPRIY